jgi:hypothetical protein
MLAATGAAAMAAAPVAASASPLALASAAAPAAPDVTVPLTPESPLKFGYKLHPCVALGNPRPTAPGSAYQIVAVECSDIADVPVGGSTGDEVFVQNEVYCQVTGPVNGKITTRTTACSGITEQVGAGSPVGTAALPAQLCGTINGQNHSPCTSERDEHAAFAFSYHPGSDAVKCSIWAESLRVSVVLPIIGHPEVSRTVLATPPYNVFSSTNALGYCLDI